MNVESFKRGLGKKAKKEVKRDAKKERNKDGNITLGNNIFEALA